MFYDHSTATTKQIGYACVLAKKLGVGSDHIDLLRWANGWSGSKAEKKCSRQTVSAAIDAALDELDG